MFTASIGLYLHDGQYYLQVIGADTQLSYVTPISMSTANLISQKEGIDVELVEECPI